VLILGGILEIGFTLVGYPLLSLSARFGDWLQIYDFDRTPRLSALTLVAHVVALAAAWRWWRGTVRRVQFAVASGEADELARLERAVADRPGDVGLWLELATVYARHGNGGLARAALDQGAAACPESARIHLARARLAVIEERWHQGMVAAEEGLAATDTDPQTTQRLWANLGLALASMEKPTHALAAFEKVGPPVADDVRVRYGRGLARLGAGDSPGGRADLEAVVAGLPEGHLLRRWAEARLAGRTPAPPDDSHLRSYQRRTTSPPAPIAGV
jgi:tetratricopeptide (TPR) repeat protein